MQAVDILNALPTLTVDDRLKVIQSALALNQQAAPQFTLEQRRQHLALAALSAVDDYQPGSDLLAFEALDGEAFLES